MVDSPTDCQTSMGLRRDATGGFNASGQGSIQVAHMILNQQQQVYRQQILACNHWGRHLHLILSADAGKNSGHPLLVTMTHTHPHKMLSWRCMAGAEWKGLRPTKTPFTQVWGGPFIWCTKTPFSKPTKTCFDYHIWFTFLLAPIVVISRNSQSNSNVTWHLG